MPQTIAAEFDTRRGAEMSVEHLVQEYGFDRSAISIVSVTDENSAGTQMAGSDLNEGEPKEGAVTQPALSGRLRVSVEVDKSREDKVLKTFATYGGKQS